MKKRKLVQLKVFCKTLPESWEVKKHSTYVDSADALRLHDKTGMSLPEGVHEPTYKDKSGKERKKLFKHSRPVLQKINHYKRVKKAFVKNGEQGVIDYLIWLRNNNIRVNKLLKEVDQIKDFDQGLINIMKGGASAFWKNLMLFLYGFVKFFLSPEKEEVK